MFKITPKIGIVHIYSGNEYWYSKRHETRFNREAYCKGIIYCHGDKPLKFIFSDGLQEIVMYEHEPNKPIVKTIHEIPSFEKNGMKYFDADKFCQWYNMPEAIPNKLIINPLKTK